MTTGKVTEKVAEKVTIAKGVLPDAKTKKRFFAMLKELNIGEPQHHAKPIAETAVNGKFHVTMYIKEHADFLIRASLKDGMLRHWGQFFQFEQHEGQDVTS